MKRLHTVTLLLVLTTFSGAQLQSSTDRPCPGESVTFTCTITSLAHRWEVPFLNIIQPLNPASQRDGVISNLQFQFAVIEVIADTLITSTATVNATENLNGTLVSCTDGNLVVPDDGQNNTINLRAPLVVPGTPSVTFPIMRGQFTATWNEPTLYVNETVDAYFVNISGPNDLCGNNSNNMAQRVTERSYTCSMQTTPQEGDTYTIRVAAASCDGNLRGPESLPATLQVPDAPTFIRFQPDCPNLTFVDVVWQNTSIAEPPITEVCVNCIGDNCTFECHNASSNNPFRINNIVNGTNYTISLSLRNDFGQSRQTTPELYGNSDEQCLTPTPIPTPTTSTPPPSPTQTMQPGSSGGGGLSPGIIAAIVVVAILIAVLVTIIIIIVAYLIWRKNRSHGHKDEDIKLKEKSPDKTPPPDNTDSAPAPILYADPNTIPREEHPTTGDVYTMPDKKKRTHKPEDHLPTYQDPGAISHEVAPAGDLYTVPDKKKGAKKKQQASRPTEEQLAEMYSQPDKTRKEQSRGLNYADVGFNAPSGGKVPDKPPQVFYSDVNVKVKNA